LLQLLNHFQPLYLVIGFTFVTCQAEAENLAKKIQGLKKQLQETEHITKENQQLQQQLQEKEQQMREKAEIILGHCEASMN